jgi:hypothetical protein
MSKQNDDYLYHYTTVDAFLEIVEKQEIWASNIFYLNDTAEFHLAVKLARDLLRDEINNVQNNLGKQRLEEVYKLLDKVGPSTIMNPVFVWSLSEDGDDLNQWRAYCRNGGVAVGFRRKELHDLTQKQGYGFAPQLVQCIYEEDEQRRLIRPWVDEAIRAEPQGSIGKKMSLQEVDQFRAEFLKVILSDKP